MHDVYADVFGCVVGVTDGDTIKVLDASNTLFKVRLTGIDAPERGQPFGTASTRYLSLLVSGKDVLVESNKSDRYGRLLGKIWVQPPNCSTCGKTLDANLALLQAGMGWWYRYYAKQQSKGDRRDYEKAENDAQARALGLWSESNPIKPYDWRKGRR